MPRNTIHHDQRSHCAHHMLTGRLLISWLTISMGLSMSLLSMIDGLQSSHYQTFTKEFFLSKQCRRPSSTTTTTTSSSSSSRRQIRMAAKPSSASAFIASKPPFDEKLQFGLGKFAFSLLPLSPESIGRRKSLLTEVVKDRVWTIDQVQGIINVNVPVRCTILRFINHGPSGSDCLFINNPVAPTSECISLIQELETRYNAPVKYITLSSLALEHKGTAGAFSSYFPSSTVYLQPGQYAFPIDLPTFLFFPLGKPIKCIPQSSRDAPWFEEMDHAVLGPLRPKGPGGFAETAFFHRDTGTLLVTDAVIRVDDAPPAIIAEDPRALLYHSRDYMTEEVEASDANLRKGWRRMVLFGLFFQPSGIKVKDTFEAIKMLDQVSPAMKALGEGAIPYSGGLYPWDWVQSEVPSFKALQGGLLVAPILQSLILNREPERVFQWVDKICTWKFTRVIPCHFANDVAASPGDFRRAFDFLAASDEDSSLLSSLWNNMIIMVRGKPEGATGTGIARKGPRPLLQDMQFLNTVSETLTKQNVLFPEAAKVKR